jgi:hypothetical protein
MPPKAYTPRKPGGTPRKGPNKKAHHEEPKPGATEVEVPKVDKRRIAQMVKAIFADKEKKQSREQKKREQSNTLTIPERKYFDLKYKQERKSERLEAQQEARKQKKEAHLLELKQNEESEQFLRKMCDQEGISKLVENKYKNMVSFIREVLEHDIETDGIEEQRNKNDIMSTFKFAIRDLEPLSKPYKNAVRVYTNRVKKLDPKVRGAKNHEIFVRWIKQMEEDSEKITTERNKWYKNKDMVSKLKVANEGITPEQIDATTTLIKKKLDADALQKINTLARKKKNEKIAEARANSGDMSGRESDVSSLVQSPIVRHETSGEFSDEN